MANPLYNIPGLGGYLAYQDRQRAIGQEDEANQIKQIQLADLYDKMQEKKAAEEQAQKLGGTLGFIQAETRPEDIQRQSLAAIMQQGSPADRSEIIKDMVKEPKVERMPDFAQLINIRDAYAAKGDMRNAGLLDAQIKKMNEGIPKNTGETPSDILARERFEWEKSHYGQEKPMTAPQRQKFEGAKAKDTAAVQIADRTTNTLIDEIDKLIGNEEKGTLEHGGLKGSVGYLDEMMPPFTKEQADAQALIKGLLAKTSVAGLQDIRQSGTAPGSITEKEWPIFQNYIKTIDPKQSHPQFVQQLKELRQIAKEFQDSAHKNYDSRYSVENAPSGTPAQPPINAAPKNAILMLKANPSLAPQFKEKYGYLP